MPRVKIVTEKEVLAQANKFQEVYRNKVDEGQELRQAVHEPSQQDAGFAVEKIDLEALDALGVNGLRVSSKTYGFVLMQRLTTPGTVLNVEIGGQVLSLGPGSKIKQPSQQARITLAPESTARKGTAYLLKLQTPLIDYEELSPLFTKRVSTLATGVFADVEPSTDSDGIDLAEVATGAGWHLAWACAGDGSVVVSGGIEVWAYEPFVGWSNTGITYPMPVGVHSGITPDVQVLVPYGRVAFVARGYSSDSGSVPTFLDLYVSRTVEGEAAGHVYG